MSWTDERVETLKKMWSDGQSASQIAKELGGVTRNAVIGKVHRLGLSNRAGAAVPGPGGAVAPGIGMAGPEADDDAIATPPVHGSGDDMAEDGPVLAPAGQASVAAASLTAAFSDVLDEDGADDDDADEDSESTAASLRARSEARDPPEPPMSAARRAIIPAGQPLPPQPSLNEISPEALAKVNEVEKTAKRLTLMELTEKTCKWPVGDPATPDFWFCGLPVQQGKPYCEAHVGVAFQPMSARRDRRR